MRSPIQVSEADIIFSKSTLWCGSPQRPALLLVMKEEELEARAQRTPAPSCAHGHQAVTKFLMPPTPTCAPAGMACTDTWLGERISCFWSTGSSLKSPTAISPSLASPWL
ncbi:mCG1036166 [Mus musculus]|nr:mCG1036166 [Mus musculus]